MINLTFLALHSSSSLKIYGNMEALAKRKDLYTGDDFYFGFDSSNQSFLGIVEGKQPLAIKHGPTLSIYQRDVNGYHFELFLIDAHAQKLIPIIKMQAKPLAASLFKSLLPFAFTDFYMNPYEKAGEAENKMEFPEQAIAALLETLANNAVLSPQEIEQLQLLVSDIDGCTITLSDLRVLAVKRCDPKPALDDFVAPYNPFDDNSRVDAQLLLKMHPSRVIVREIQDKYPRIEVIIPGLPGESGYIDVFKSEKQQLFMDLQVALSKPELVQPLLKAHFPEQINEYFAHQGLLRASSANAP